MREFYLLLPLLIVDFIVIFCQIFLTLQWIRIFTTYFASVRDLTFAEIRSFFENLSPIGKNLYHATNPKSHKSWGEYIFETNKNKDTGIIFYAIYITMMIPFYISFLGIYIWGLVSSLIEARFLFVIHHIIMLISILTFIYIPFKIASRLGKTRRKIKNIKNEY